VLSINELKSGVTILVNGEVYVIVDTQHIKPGKGSAIARLRLRNLKNDRIQEKTFRGDQTVERAYVEEKKLQYLYNSQDTYHFMNQDNFEEVTIPQNSLEDKKGFLKDNLTLSGYFYNDEILNINLPNFIVFEIRHTEPGIRGDTAKGGTKPAETETGATIQVPLFINVGDKIKVDTRTGEYVERAN